MWSIFSRDPTKDFPFEIGEKVDGLEDQSIWRLCKGRKKSNAEPVSVFEFDIASNSDAVKQVALASVKRLKTLRHPSVLTFIDSLETPKNIYIVTEPVVPLSIHLRSYVEENDSKTVAISWGIHQMAHGLSFLLNTVNLIHNNVCLSSVFVDTGGEWKLGGIDYMYPASGEGSNLPPFKTLPILEKYDPPEKSAKNRSRKSSKWSADMWGLGCLIWEVFNGPLPRTSSLKVIGKIPKNLVPHYCELVGANPASRPSPDNFIANCRKENCFMKNHFVDTNLFLGEIQIKDTEDKNKFFSELPKHLDSFPVEYSKLKILPQLLNAFQFGNAGSAVLPPLFKLGSLLDKEDYQSQIVPCVVKLFSSSDRATRIHLLRQLPLFIEHLDAQVVNSQIFPNIITGFMDTNPAIREQSIKSMLLLASKLNDNNLNNELMKHFARLQSRDDQGPIRTNTTVCIGKIACYLNAATRQKVVSSAFIRAMRDPFPAARVAGVLAMANNIKYFGTKDCAFKALPALCSLTVDPDKNVRVNTFKTITAFLSKLEKASEDPEYASQIETEAAAATPGGATGAVVAGVTGWTGWMSTGVTSLTSRLYKKPQDEKNAEDGDKAAEKDEKEEVEIEEGSQEEDKSDYEEEEEDATGWDDLEMKEEEEEDGKENEESWDDSGWDADGFETVEKKTEARTSSSSSKLKISSKTKQTSSGWDDWADEDDFASEWQEKSNVKEQKNTSNNMNPASSYNWSSSTASDPNSKDFFSDLITTSTKPQVKKSTMLNKQKTISKPSSKVAEKREIKKKETKEAENSEFGNDWGWGDDANDIKEEEEGLSKADLMKKQREEKRRQRQEELERKRAARSGGKAKLGARKMD